MSDSQSKAMEVDEPETQASGAPSTPAVASSSESRPTPVNENAGAQNDGPAAPSDSTPAPVNGTASAVPAVPISEQSQNPAAPPVQNGTDPLSVAPAPAPTAAPVSNQAAPAAPPAPVTTSVPPPPPPAPAAAAAAGPSADRTAKQRRLQRQREQVAAEKAELLRKKDKKLGELLLMLDDYKPLIPDEVTDHYLQKSGFECDDVRLKRLLSLAAQKFVSDIATDAMHYAKIRGTSGGGSGGPSGGGGGGAVGGKKGDQSRSTLTMEDLSLALADHGVNAKKPDYYF